MKLKSITKWGQYVILALFIGLLFTTDLKAEVFGFVQRGMLQLGLFQPATEEVQPASDNTGRRPQLQLTNQEGENVQLADLEGKVVFMNFWATWCPPCVAEMPSINKFYQNYKDNDKVVFLMVNRDRNFAKGKSFLDRKDFDFDIHQIRGSAAPKFKPRSLPTTYIIDKTGEIQFTHAGMANYNTSKFKDMMNKFIVE